MVIHTYPAGGTYTAAVTVVDPDGAEDTATVDVTVTDVFSDSLVVEISGAVDLTLAGPLDTDGFTYTTDRRDRVRSLVGTGTLPTGEEIRLWALRSSRGYFGIITVKLPSGERLILPFSRATLSADEGFVLAGTSRWYKFSRPRGPINADWEFRVSPTLIGGT